jgi:hypothetical protein
VIDLKKAYCTKQGIDIRVYRAWQAMRRRCADHPDYRNRGIKVCARWYKFANFAADMGPHPGKGWSLEREDNDGNYEPDNCSWATKNAQNRNRRMTKLTLRQAEDIRQRPRDYGYQCRLAEEFGVSQPTISNIICDKNWIGV